ncbi:hypothetical protein LCGC14_3140500, partial [marine sediment metagenome]
MNQIGELLDDVYNAYEGSEMMADFSERHGIASAAVLTVFDEDGASLIAEHLRPRIEGKTV